MLDFFGEEGGVIAYLDNDGKSIFLWCGKPVAYLIEDNIYSYSGKHLGWLEEGWVYDHLGDDVLSSHSSFSIPNKSVRQTPPTQRFTESPPAKPQRTFRWSVFGEESFFQ